MMGTIEGIILTIVVEKGNRAIWTVHWDTKFQAALAIPNIRMQLSVQGLVTIFLEC